MLTERLDAVTQQYSEHFGASTGAAAALYAAASFRDVKAVLSRGGRTDLVDKKTLEDVKMSENESGNEHPNMNRSTLTAHF